MKLFKRILLVILLLPIGLYFINIPFSLIHSNLRSSDATQAVRYFVGTFMNWDNENFHDHYRAASYLVYPDNQINYQAPPLTVKDVTNMKFSLVTEIQNIELERVYNPFDLAGSKVFKGKMNLRQTSVTSVGSDVKSIQVTFYLKITWRSLSNPYGYYMTDIESSVW